MKIRSRAIVFTMTALMAGLHVVQGSEQQRIWTHTNGRSIAGILKEVQGREVVIAFGDQDIRIALDNLSYKDRAYLLESGHLDHLKQENDAQGIDGEEKKVGGGATPSPAPPENQVAFYSMLSNFHTEYVMASNDLQRSSIRTKRQKEIERQLGERRVENWVAEVVSMRTNSDRNAIITLKVDHDFVGLEKPGGFSVIIRNSSFPVKHDSPVYEKMSRLQVGGRFTFSGQFIACKEDYIKEDSLTEFGSMSEPEFDFRFDDE